LIVFGRASFFAIAQVGLQETVRLYEVRTAPNQGDKSLTIDISIITPARNAGPFIAEAIHSVSNQSFRNFEHVVLDDASTDNTRSIIKEAAALDLRIKPILLDTQVGSIKGRNIAIASSKGRYLAFLDADDVWLPKKLETQLRFMRERRAAMSFTDYRHMSMDGRLVGRPICGPNQIDWKTLHASRYIGCLTVMLDRDDLPDFHFPSVFPAVRAEDFLAWSNALKTVRLAYRCPVDLARYRLLKRSRSSNRFSAVSNVWHLYRDVECIPVVSALYYLARFLTSSAAKHLKGRPYIQRTLIDRAAQTK
jgi:teichuronic acid biosynthesis glycosyltransferase TuaG